MPTATHSPTKITYIDGAPATLHLRRIRLVCGQGEARRSHLFEQDVVTIGGMPGNDLVLGDDTASRHHCRIVQHQDHTMLVDLGSTNGTYINGVRIKEAYLSPGAMIAVGNTQVRFDLLHEQVELDPLERENFAGIIGRSAKMRALFAILEKISPTKATVVIEGETGTGKEVVAQAIHKRSAHPERPFVVFDCSAVPPNLIESELFGHEKGSFTGALVTRKGLFEMAQGGTIFLDELGELGLDLQPKLLRVLEQREIRRVGSNTSIPIQVRVVAATNRDLEHEVAQGRFREDLFYRLGVVRINLPPLRERPEDIPLLAGHLLGRIAARSGSASGPRSVSPPAMAQLQRYSWPGNVRELVNVLERASLMAPLGGIRPEDLPPEVLQAPSTPPPTLGASAPVPQLEADERLQEMPFKQAKEKWVSSFEKDYIEELLARHEGNISQASREAEIDRKYFRKLMTKYGIEA